MLRSDNMIKHNNAASITSKPTLTHFSKYGLNISELSLRVWVQGCETAHTRAHKQSERVSAWLSLGERERERWGSYRIQSNRSQAARNPSTVAQIPRQPDQPLERNASRAPPLGPQPAPPRTAADVPAARAASPRGPLAGVDQEERKRR